MCSDSINRIPPTALDTLRSAPTPTTPIIKRDQGSGGQYHGEPRKDDDTPHDPEDLVELSSPVPEIDENSDDVNNPDRFWAPLSAVQDLLHQHKNDYPPTEWARLSDQLAFLESHGVPSLYWPPHIPLQDAITRACQTVSLPPF